MRAPSDRDATREDAGGAALKAIQSLELLSQGKAVHPRWSDVSYPDFFLQRCTQCKRCTEECPFGTLNEDEEKPRLLGLVCENDAYPALDLVGQKRIKHSPWIRFIPVRCLGSVNVVWIGDALSSGYDGILLLGCKSGDDYQCHFIRGSELMGTRGENIQEKLKQLVLEEERVRVEEISIDDFEKIPQIINEFAEEIEEIGPNPFKGF
jgi:quinone-modifying oxidoreductase subunit QmoB